MPPPFRAASPHPPLGAVTRHPPRRLCQQPLNSQALGLPGSLYLVSPPLPAFSFLRFETCPAAGCQILHQQMTNFRRDLYTNVPSLTTS